MFEHGGGRLLSLPGISLHSSCVSFSLSIIPVFFKNKVAFVYEVTVTSDYELSGPVAFETFCQRSNRAAFVNNQMLNGFINCRHFS